MSEPKWKGVDPLIVATGVELSILLKGDGTLQTWGERFHTMAGLVEQWESISRVDDVSPHDVIARRWLMDALTFDPHGVKLLNAIRDFIRRREQIDRKWKEAFASVHHSHAGKLRVEAERDFYRKKARMNARELLEKYGLLKKFESLLEEYEKPSSSRF